MTGKVTHYETFRLQTNLRDPKPWESIKRFDATGKGHVNKITQFKIDTPHVHDPNCQGEIRLPEIWEIPK
jgi:hypothetical protein